MAFRVLQRMSHCLCEVGEILRAEIGQVHVLRPSPDLFIGIEFRGMRGQPFDLDPPRESLSQVLRGGEMNRPTIQDQDDPVGKMFEEFRHKALDLGGTEVVLLEPKAQGQMLSLRRDRDRRNSGEAVVAFPTVLEGRVPLGTPGPADHRLEHKAGFIEKNEAPAASSSFFLSAASLVDATGRWLLRRVRAPALRVSDSSSRCHAARARPRKGRSEHRNASRSRRRSASTSTSRSDSRGREGPATAIVPASGVARPSAWAGDQDGAWPSSLPAPPGEKSSSTGTPPPARRRVSGPPRWDGDRSPATRGPEAVDIRALRVFLGFSCMRISTRHGDLL